MRPLRGLFNLIFKCLDHLLEVCVLILEVVELRPECISLSPQTGKVRLPNVDLEAELSELLRGLGSWPGSGVRIGRVKGSFMRALQLRRGLRILPFVLIHDLTDMLQ